MLYSLTFAGSMTKKSLRSGPSQSALRASETAWTPFGHAAVWQVTDQSNFNLDAIADTQVFYLLRPYESWPCGSSMAALWFE